MAARLWSHMKGKTVLLVHSCVGVSSRPGAAVDSLAALVQQTNPQALS